MNSAPQRKLLQPHLDLLKSLSSDPVARIEDLLSYPYAAQDPEKFLERLTGHQCEVFTGPNPVPMLGLIFMDLPSTGAVDGKQRALRLNMARRTVKALEEWGYAVPMPEDSPAQIFAAINSLILYSPHMRLLDELQAAMNIVIARFAYHGLLGASPVEAGIDVNVIDPMLLYHAAQEKNLPVALALIKSGCNPMSTCPLLRAHMVSVHGADAPSLLDHLVSRVNANPEALRSAIAEHAGWRMNAVIELQDASRDEPAPAAAPRSRRSSL